MNLLHLKKDKKPTPKDASASIKGFICYTNLKGEKISVSAADLRKCIRAKTKFGRVV